MLLNCNFATLDDMRGLVLSGGGARGAYQAGVLKAVFEICSPSKVKTPFHIYSGVSAGALNATYLAAGAHSLAESTFHLTELWSNMTSDQVFRTDAVTMGKIGLKWMGELSLGAISGATPGRSLLDTEPLWDLIRKNCRFSQIGENLQKDVFKSLAITSVDYQSSTAVTFVENNNKNELWQKNKRHAERTIISVEHVMASSAIPILFPPIKVGPRYFGDGCVRNIAPCSPAIRLGAKKLMVIGVRAQKDLRSERLMANPPSVARVINLLLNAVLLDGVEIDIERMQRINEFLAKVPQEHHTHLNFRPVDALLISPSEDLGAMAAQMASKMPRVVRFLLKGLGPLEDASELISYLLFEKEYTNWLVELGYKDGMSRESDIKEFFKD